MKKIKWFTYALILGGVAVGAAIYSGLPQKLERAYGPAGTYVPPAPAELDTWNANDVRRHYESRGIVLPPDVTGITLANGRYFSRQEIYGNPLLNEFGLARIMYRPPGQGESQDDREVAKSTDK